MATRTPLRGTRDWRVGEVTVDVDPVADFGEALRGRAFATVLANPPWQFINRTGKVAMPQNRQPQKSALSKGHM